MSKIYHVIEDSLYPAQGFVAWPEKDHDSSSNKVWPINGRTKMLGFIAQPKNSSLSEKLVRQFPLNGRLRMFGYVARPETRLAHD